MSKAAVRANWSVTTLGQIAGLVMGKTPPRNEKKYWTDELTYPFCTIADMEGKWIHPQREGVTSTALQNAKARKVAAGSLMLSFKLTIGRVGFAGVDLYPNEAIVAIDVDANISTKEYLYLVLGSQDLTHGSGRAIKGATLNSASLAAIPLVLPPLSEQRRIVDVMDSVDTYIAALQQQADGARTARNAVLHELLTAGGGDWTETTLGELVTVQKGKKPPFLGKKTTAGEPYLTADVLRGSTPSQFVPPSALTACVQLQGNETILLWDGAGAGDVFRSAAGVLASTMAKLAIKQIGLIDADYLYLVVVDAAPEIKSSCRGTTVPHVSPSALTALPLTLPPRPEQQRIVGIVSAMDDVISATEKAVSNAHGLRSGLLASLLSGEHEIPETYDRLLGVA